mmetsp:Transcript_123765/g.385400  ORF Transcript_123765/g.385400 Transcript_123765/m.385400 type:complete len:270 (+) Transcript_123765:790-1599(+)
MPLRGIRPESRDPRESSAARPAAAPSSGAPPGKCTWSGSSSAPPGPRLECSRQRFARDRATSTLSWTGGPGLPVTSRRAPPPGAWTASTEKSWAPSAEAATPRATPTAGGCAPALGGSCGPRMWDKCPASTRRRPPGPGPQEARATSASGSRPRPGQWPRSRRAAQRQICARWRSSERTPLSDVQSTITLAIASGVSMSSASSSSSPSRRPRAPRPSTATPSPRSSGKLRSSGGLRGLAGVSPSRCSAWSRRCLGSRCRAAIAHFSSRV